MKLDSSNAKPFPKWHTDNLSVYAAGQTAIEKGETEFDCPVCGKKARVERSDYNGHIHCFCPSCKSGVIE